MKNRQGGYVSITEIVVLAFLLVLGSLVVWGAIHHETVNMHEAYHAWVKQTENPKDLTYEEWRALNRAETSRNTSIIFIPQ